MKYKEFAKKLEELDLYVEYNEVKQITIYTARQVPLAIIDDNDQYDLYFSGKCRLLSPETREKFFSLAVEYASMPIENRRPESKYRVVAFRCKNGTPKNITESVAFYRRDCFGALDWTYDRTYTDESQKWTMKQIKEYKLESCERIVVANDEK